MNGYSKRTAVREAVIIAIVLVVMTPFYFLLNISLKTNSDALTTPAIQPAPHPSLSSFIVALSAQGSRSILLGIFNSVIITAGALVVLVLLGSIAAFTLTRLPGRLSSALYFLVVIGIILPFQLGLIPIYVAMRTLGLLGTHVGMILLYSGLCMPLSVFLYSGFTRTLAREYEEAAQIDGASKWQTFRNIIFPLLSPATGTVAILCGLIIWNDFFTSVVFLNGSPAATLPVVVYSFVGEQVSAWNIVFAAVLVSMLPILIFYLAAQKKFIQGFAGGLKS